MSVLSLKKILRIVADQIPLVNKQFKNTRKNDKIKKMNVSLEIICNKIFRDGFLFFQILIVCSPALFRIHITPNRSSFSYLK